MATVQTSPKPHLDVVGAVIVRDGLVFATQRATGFEAGLWEFPGGKVEADESPEQALVREILEELGVEIVVGRKVTTSFTENPAAKIDLTTYVCTLKSAAEPIISASHSDARWLLPEQLYQLKWAAADERTVRYIATKLFELE